MGEVVGSASDWLFDLFGGWPNVMQGFGGAFVAVLGAFYVARWTVRHELKQQDKRARDAGSAEAATQVLAMIAPFPELLRELQHADFDQQGISHRYLTAWVDRQHELRNQLRTHGMLLPANVEAAVTTLADSLGRNLFKIDEDEDIGVLDLWLSDSVEAAIAMSESTSRLLQDFRREPASSRRM